MLLQNIEVNNSASATQIFSTDKTTFEFMSTADTVQYNCHFYNTMSQTTTVLLYWESKAHE